MGAIIKNIENQSSSQKLVMANYPPFLILLRIYGLPFLMPVLDFGECVPPRAIKHYITPKNSCQAFVEIFLPYAENIILQLIEGCEHMVNLGERLRKLRLEKHLTQTEMSRRIGVSKAMISSYELEQRQPSYGILVKFAAFFGRVCRFPTRPRERPHHQRKGSKR